MLTLNTQGCLLWALLSEGRSPTGPTEAHQSTGEGRVLMYRHQGGRALVGEGRSPTRPRVLGTSWGRVRRRGAGVGERSFSPRSHSPQ